MSSLSTGGSSGNFFGLYWIKDSNNNLIADDGTVTTAPTDAFLGQAPKVFVRGVYCAELRSSANTSAWLGFSHSSGIKAYLGISGAGAASFWNTLGGSYTLYTNGAASKAGLQCAGSSNNISICIGSVTATYGGGEGCIFIANATTVPTTDPTGGGLLYTEAGALKYRGSSGTVTQLAPA